MAWHSEHCNWLLEQVEMIKWWKTSAKVCSQSARLTELIESRGHRFVSFKRKTNDNFLSLPLTQYSMVHQRAFCNGIRWSQANQIYFWYFLSLPCCQHTHTFILCVPLRQMKSNEIKIKEKSQMQRRKCSWHGLALLKSLFFSSSSSYFYKTEFLLLQNVKWNFMRFLVLIRFSPFDLLINYIISMDDNAH